MDGNRGRGFDAFAWAGETERLLWAVRVRWAVLGGFSGLAAALHLAGVFADIRPLGWAVLLGACTNAVNHVCVRRRRGVIAATVVAVVMDNVLITFSSASTGGFHSPMVVMYSVQVVATAMLVNTPAALVSATLAALGGAVLVALEGWGLTGRELLLPAAAHASPAEAARLGAVAWGVLLGYGLLLLVFVGGFVSERLRASEGRLAERNRELALALERLQQAEAQLVHGEKMRALGQIVAGVAHEINNPISFVSSNLQHLRGYCDRLSEFVREQRRHLEDPEALEEVLVDLPPLLDDCQDGARRVQRIVADLRGFARTGAKGGREPWGEVDVESALERTIRILRHRVPNGVRVELSLGGVPAVNGSEGELEQVFVNLVANALDAVGDEGRVDLQTSADRDRVRVRVADDGPGVPPENLHRVFEPFFTTKPVGQGTGVGLSLSYAIVRRHGGALEVASEPGCGAIFTVTLPRADFHGGRSLKPAAN